MSRAFLTHLASETEALHGQELFKTERILTGRQGADITIATEMACHLLDEDIYVIGFAYPVVPEGQARIRTQMSAAHTPEHIDSAVAAFAKVGRAMGVIS